LYVNLVAKGAPKIFKTLAPLAYSIGYHQEGTTIQDSIKHGISISIQHDKLQLLKNIFFFSFRHFGIYLGRSYNV
jgi:hypothetical protein